MRFEGKTVVITGGGGPNIGRALVLRFAEEGANVVVADADISAARQTARLAGQVGAKAKAIKTDVSREQDCERMADAAVDAFGRLDVAVASAGFGYESMPLIERPLTEWRRMLDVVLTGVMLTDRACARRMTKGGAIVNIASMAAYHARVGGGHYEAAKAGVLVVTKTLAQELAPRIRVNAIAPGWTVRPELRAERKDFYRRVERGIPLGRVGTPRDVANVAAFLASDEAGYITGEFICCDGGQHAATRH